MLFKKNKNDSVLPYKRNFQLAIFLAVIIIIYAKKKLNCAAFRLSFCRPERGE